MNKFILVLVIGTFGISAFGQPSTKFDERLKSRMDQNPKTDIDAFIWMNAQVDLVALRNESNTKRFTSSKMATTLITKLKEVATNTSALLNERLQPYVLQGKVNNYKQNWITNGFQITTSPEVLEEIAQWPEVAGIYENFTGTANFTKSDKSSENCMAPGSREPGLDAINAPAMWALGYTGYGRKAYIFDSGEDYNHPAIRQQFYGNYNDFKHSWSGGNDEPFDIFGHGTHVTGTICGLNRSTKDTIGVAFNGNWMGGPIQFRNSNAPTQPYATLSFVDNMQYALDPDKNANTTDDMPDVVNNSWSGFLDCSRTEPFSQVMVAMEMSGIANIWSAGNDGPNGATLSGYQNINTTLISGFAIGATQKTAPYDIADFSSRGPSLCSSTGGALAIKPEVSAPGVLVRSSINGGGYADYNGTSMASPHVSGAILLLKEAFPYLPGDSLIYALYYSATDLGAPGEDNVYGRGIINVYNAFLYLQSHGHIPYPPISADHDILVLDLRESVKGNYCKGPASFSFSVYNNGIETVDHFSYVIKQTFKGVETIETHDWSGSLLPNEQVDIALPPIEFTQAGNAIYEVTVEAENDLRTLNNTWRREFEVMNLEYLNKPVLVNGPLCKGDTAELKGVGTFGNRVPYWYNQIKGGSPIGKGIELNTKVIANGETYYFDVLKEFSVGEKLLSNPVDFLSTKQAGLVFDAFTDIYIDTFSVFLKAPANFFINITTGDGKTSYWSKVITNSTAGENILSPKVYLPKSNNYKIFLVLGKDLAITKTNVKYPYIVSDVMRIKYNTGLEDSLKVYPYFYNWKISVPYECGREEVKLDVVVDSLLERGPTSINASVDTLDLKFSNSVSFTPNKFELNLIHSWDFGNGETSTDVATNGIYTQPGIYDVRLTLTGATGCTRTITKKIYVKDSSVGVIDLKEANLTLIPNPVAANFHIELDDHSYRSGQLKIFDITGKEVLSYEKFTTTDNVEVNNFHSGLYMLQFKTNDTMFKARFVKL